MIVNSTAQWLLQTPHKLHKGFLQYRDIILANWHLGVTAFGGPPVHFQIWHVTFVEKLKWIDEQTYQELFAVSQALPGPASTKMLYTINALRGGLGAGFLSLLLWCLPGALGMYGLSLGVSNIGEDLHPAVFALLSGLNSATVGIIALAAVQLSEKAITDQLTRLIVFFTGAAGMLYTALWYFPVLMISGGLSTFIWDFQYLQSAVKTLQRHNLLPQRRAATADAEANGSPEPVNIPERVVTTSHSTQTGRQSPSLRSGRGATPRLSSSQNSEGVVETTVASTDSNAHITPSNLRAVALSWKQGACLVAAFLVSFVTVMILRGVLKAPPLGFSLFANLYLAGTIIFGGGPVVIPLLREYVVAEGWVSPRDFLLGLAVIQAFPGPNFNFAVYLGSLTMIGVSRSQSFLGALLGFVAIFLPGIWIVTGVMGVWRVLRTRRWLLALLRGINAAAVGLVYTAIYNLFKIGLVTAANGQGASLGNDPWWVAVTAGAYVGGKYFGVPAPAAIIAGGIAGLIRFGVVDA